MLTGQRISGVLGGHDVLKATARARAHRDHLSGRELHLAGRPSNRSRAPGSSQTRGVDLDSWRHTCGCRARKCSRYRLASQHCNRSSGSLHRRAKLTFRTKALSTLWAGAEARSFWRTRNPSSVVSNKAGPAEDAINRTPPGFRAPTHSSA